MIFDFIRSSKWCDQQSVKAAVSCEIDKSIVINMINLINPQSIHQGFGHRDEKNLSVSLQN